MRIDRIGKLGWVVAAALAGILLGGGFQADTNKFGVVDFAAVVEKSDYYKNGETQVKAMQATREGVLEFLFTYKVATSEQAQKLRTLSLKDNLNGTEKQELEKIKADVKEADKSDKQLATKPNPTADDTNLMRDYANRKRSTEELLGRWQQEFEQELQKRFQEMRSTAVERARQSVAEVGKSGGYTIVYRADVAPYGANDLTDAALKSMNAKK